MLMKPTLSEVNCRWDELSPEKQLKVIRLINHLATYSHEDYTELATSFIQDTQAKA